MRSLLCRFLGAGLSASTLALLSACGGGGDGGAAPIVVPATTVSGIASKGLVRQAKVLVCRIIDGAPQADASCETGTTGQNGAFSVALGDGFTGPAMIKVTTSPSSMMLDETTGQDIRYDMTMRSVVPAVSSATTTYVTPFSEMLASAVGATSSGVGTAVIDAETIDRKALQVQTMTARFGIDFAVMPMIDLQNSGSDPVMLGKQANLVKQLARIVLLARNSDEIHAPPTFAPCNAPGTTITQQIACTTGYMTYVMSLDAHGQVSNWAWFAIRLLAQNPVSVAMPVVRKDGTLVYETADMTSAASMESAMLAAGMSPAVVTATVQIMMQQMR